MRAYGAFLSDIRRYTVCEKRHFISVVTSTINQFSQLDLID